ncbi:hypothetical protein B0H63DRAFT_529540 [Podospora didyma]|uniref:Avirulence Effector AvrLm4-7 domain-containing protein n=1 Tax=Podospora didyma TaxID=330526 RepID=A0AAE0K192_9PEZI|nr:hypothetical protein B0H63DRAFT_529540 [Podospora didyma]
MKPTSAATALLAASAASVVNAYHVRIGHKEYSISFGVKICQPFFKVWEDDWTYAGEKEFTDWPNAFCPTKNDKWCSFWTCPWQVDGITIGIRVVEDGGGDGAIRVEAWKGSKSTWTWCQKGTWTEGGGQTQFKWQCDFIGL